MNIDTIYSAKPKQANRSNEKADVARRILELSETVGEAIEYILYKADSYEADVGDYAGTLKDIGEGLISLENASKSISSKTEAERENSDLLESGYDDLAEKLDALAEACLDNRTSDFIFICGMLRDSFSDYSERLTRCFRGMSIM